MRIAGKYVRGFLQRHPKINRAKERIVNIAKAHNALHRAISGMPNEQVRSVRQFMEDRDVLGLIGRREDSINLLMKGILFTDAYHQVSNLLTDIAGKLATLSKMPDKVLQRYSMHEFGEKLFWKAKGVVNIIRMIRAASKQSLGIREEDLEEILQEIKMNISSSFKQLDIILENKTIGTKVPLDLSRFGFALFNLILNSHQHEANKIVLEVNKIDDDHVQIRIIDNGNGFDKNIREQISKPGFTTKKEDGFGFGTSIAKGIIEEHGGSFDIDSPGVGKGCIVTITLPTV